MSITSVINDTVTSVSLVNAQKPLPPTISGYSVGGLDDTALDPAGGQTVQINGTGFLPGATITFDGNAVAVVTYVSPNQLTFTSPAKSAGTYTIYVVNADGGTAIYIPGIIYSVLPTWTTSAGSLGSVYETNNISTSVVASGDAPITYSLYSGSLPSGATLYANGVISGSAPVDSSSTTYSFTIEAIDAQLQGSTRSFSLTINADVVTWVSPANATTYTSAVDSAIANVTLSATDAAGYGIVYTANALPTGLTLSGNTISGTPTVIADSSTLLTATANTTSRTATRTINWSITVANDPYFEYNTLLIPGASTTFVDDASTNNFGATINGDTKPNSSNPYTPGYYSNYFDGTGDYLQKVSPPTYLCDWTTTNFTIEYWVFASAFGSGANGGSNVLGNVNDAGDSEYWTFGPISNGSVRFYYYNGAPNSFTTSTTLSTNKWYHLAFVNNSGSLAIYINGVSSATSTKAGTPQFGSAIAFSIGKCTGSAFNGYISNLRIVQSAVYTSNFTPSTSPLTAISGTQLLTSQSNRIIDNSTNNVVFTVYGDTSVKSFDPFLPNSSYSTYGSGYFDGTGDYLSNIGTTSSFNFLHNSTALFTVEAWVFLTSTGTQRAIMDTTAAGSAGIGLWLGVETDNTLRIFMTKGSPTNPVCDGTSSSAIPLNQWAHIVLTYDQSLSSANAKYYINGAAAGSTTKTANAPSNSNASYPATVGGYNGGGAYFIGYMCDIRINSTIVYSSAFTPPTTPLTAISGTSLLTLQNNQSVNNNVFLDYSTNNFLITRNGNPTQGTSSPYGGNWSNYFGTANGNSLYLSAQSSGTGGVALSGNYTIEFWLYPTSASTSPYSLMVTTNTNGSYLQFAYYSDGKIGYNNLASGASWYYTSPSAITFNTWNHIALVRSSNVTKVYVNGVEKAFDTSNTDSATVYANYIGGLGTIYNTFGYISNLRILNGTALYTTTFTPPTSPLTAIANTALLTCQSNRFVDNSLNNYTINLAGAPTIQRFSPFNPSSLTPTSYSGYFDGTGDYLTVPANSAFNFGTGDFTVELWYNFSSVASVQSLITVYQNSSNGWGLQWRNDTNRMNWFFGDTIIMSYSMAPTVGTWAHVAVTRSGTSLRMFINGTVVVGPTTNSTTFDSSQGLSIGSLYYALGPSYIQNYNGYLSNVRIVKGTAVYTSDFTPPTSPLTAISGTSLLTCQSPTFVDNSTNNFTITANGNTQPTQQNPFGYTSTTTNGYTVSTIGGSAYFDGTGDYLTYGSSSLFSFGTNDFTIEAWIYVTSYGTGFSIFTVGGASAGSYAIYTTNSTNKIQSTRYGDTAGAGTTTNTIPLNTWVHVAAVRKSGTAYVYLNGVADSGATYSMGSVTNTGASTGLIFGTNPTGIGYVSDLRVINGTALYSSNFVPPSAPVTAMQNTVLLNNMTGAGIYDAAMMNDIETVGDASLSTAVTKFGGSSMYFDGSGDYLSIPTNPIFNIGYAEFTIEMWLNRSGTGTGDRFLISRNNGADLLLRWNSSGVLQFYMSGSLVASYTWSFTTGTWYHLAVVRNGPTAVTIYINGTSVATGTSAANPSSTSPMLIGGYGPTNSDYYNGYIDDLRITKGYCRYTSNFTVPALPFPIY